ncbi:MULTISPECIES: DNA polymerase Y family protein [Ramlibacter]|uniref:DNA polymerase Y family protein n=1 Tax=Ramlibacter aquaticus TaxID=2780094 RepID=A0ABR9SD98_9BURK|nr:MULTISPECIES: DNA polymerase Y family protein [Ramlibacter]MBE7940326.1 DNA polymerase Y family protein [Ramlibacter aquaticus]
MFWIALQPSHEADLQAWSWRCLRFSPRVARLAEALVLEVAGCERLWGGRQRLMRRLFRQDGAPPVIAWGTGASSLAALATLRLRRESRALPSSLPEGLPLDVLDAAQPHLGTLERIGCRSWADLRALPRQGVSRRFGASLLRALDQAWGQVPEAHEWLALPEDFDLQAELVSLATTAPELVHAAELLLGRLQAWLRARNRGITAFSLEWALDLRKLDGQALPRTEAIEVRTAQPAQATEHLLRLVREQLARTPLAAPASHLRLRSLETQPWGGLPASLLPEDNRPGEPLHQFIERISTRLGEDQVRVAEAVSDHRPEFSQRWRPARRGQPRQEVAAPDAVFPTWLLPRPRRLQLLGGRPSDGASPLRRLTRLYRLETAWWEEGGAALRDYFIARSPQWGLVWIFRERGLHPVTGLRSEEWFLQGFYA